MIEALRSKNVNTGGLGKPSKIGGLSKAFVCLYLRNSLPLCGVILTRVDAVVPPALHHVQDGLHRDVELRRPVDLQLTRRMLQEHQLLPRLQRDS